MSPQRRARRRRLAVRLIAGAATWSVGLLLTALLAPVDSGTVSDASGLTLTTATYVQHNGAWTLIPLSLPLLAALAVAAALRRPSRRLRRLATALVLVLAGLAIVLVTGGGVLLLPVAILLAAALPLTREPAAAHRPRPAARAEMRP